MKPDEEQTTECIVYIDGVPVGTMSTEIPTITLTAEDGETGPLPVSAKNAAFNLYFAATRWTSCRTRKRFIKLMGGALGVQRNAARRLADEAMAQGCPSYMELWADCYACYIEYLLNQSVRD